jgi:hypothetical protein
MKWIFVSCLFVSVSACSSKSNYYSPPDTCDGAPGCAASAIIEGVLRTDKASQKCENMRGDSRVACDEQVKAIKDSISRAQSQGNN